MSLKEGDISLCTVKSIEGTTVFLELENGVQGTMIFSEVSPGRIRNLREFVSPNKKVVCKVIRVKDGHPELSLRRVTGKERESVLDRYKKEKMLESMMKPILKEKTIEILFKIKEKYDAAEFLNEVKNSPAIIEKFVSKSQAEDLKKIFVEKREKEKEVKREIKISSVAESGIYDIQKSLSVKNAEIYYLGSSRFSIVVKAADYKTANVKLDTAIEEIKSLAKRLNVKIEIK